MEGAPSFAKQRVGDGLVVPSFATPHLKLIPSVPHLSPSRSLCVLVFIGKILALSSRFPHSVKDGAPALAKARSPHIGFIGGWSR